jgi:hypothetical protein
MSKTTNLRYCRLCGNEKVRGEKPCAKCRAVIEGTLLAGYQHWQEADGRYGKCCGGLSSDRDYRYLHFHSEGFNDTYPQVTRGKRKGQEPGRGPFVSVEAGIDFYATEARTYYIHDTGHDVGSTVFGEAVAYGDSEFWKKIEANLDRAAEAAFNDDWQSCRKCGSMFFESCGCEE